MTKEQLKQLRKDWTALERAVENSSEATRLLDRAFGVGCKEERAHRRMMGQRTYSISVANTTRILILVHLAKDPYWQPSWLEAARTREDLLCIRALRCLLDSEIRNRPVSQQKWPFQWTWDIETAKLNTESYR